MPPIPDYIVRRVEEAARIEEVVADFVTLKHKGARYLGLCPFHDDHTIGSFSVYPAKNVYKCFKCDAKGGPVQFLMKHPRVNMTFPDAIRWLGRKYGVQTDDIDVNYVPSPSKKGAIVCSTCSTTSSTTTSANRMPANCAARSRMPTERRTTAPWSSDTDPSVSSTPTSTARGHNVL